MKTFKSLILLSLLIVNLLISTSYATSIRVSIVEAEKGEIKNPQEYSATEQLKTKSHSTKREMKLDYSQIYPPKPKTKEQLEFISTRDSFVDNLLGKMSILEKIGQMTQLDITTLTMPNTIIINETTLAYYAKTYYIGSYLNSPVSGGLAGDNHHINSSQWLNIINNIQKITIESSPNSIPMIYGLDSVHGANYVHKATLFPHNTGLAATFNTVHSTAAAVVTAKDTSAVGIPWVFAPVLGIGVQPLWPRIYETFGEDPYVASMMGAAAVRGFQGGNNSFDNPIKTPSAVATAKHYFGYSDPTSGKDRTAAWLPERMLRRYFLPSFAEAITGAGAGTIMINSGEVNGVPMHTSYKYLTEVLRNELRFEGVAVTDWQDIEKLVFFHHTAGTMEEAIMQALDAGIDMSMVPLDLSFPIILNELVEAGQVPEERLDISVRRILNLKYALGLFENPYPNPNAAIVDTIGQVEDRENAAAAVEESITLLQNKNNILPLNTEAYKNILLTGPSAHSIKNLNGGWSVHWQGAYEDSEFPFGTSILTGLQDVLNNTDVNIEYQIGTEIGVALNQSSIDCAVAAARQADVVVMVIGELPEAETPGDIDDLTMDANEILLLESVLATKTPVVLILVEARPRILPPALVYNCSAVLMAYLPGSEGGKPIANILMGNVNPSGRLPLTYPGYTGDIGVPYYHKYSEIGVTSPLFQFGEGLSYTIFNYTNLQLNAIPISGQPGNYSGSLGSTYTVTVTVTNNGAMAGKDSVLLYLSDLWAQVTPEVKMLRGFQKVDLAPQESTTIEFTLSPYDFSFIGIDNKITLESGQFVIAIGNQQVSLYLQ
ncbi:beta glucosidase [Dictyostelium purpureum]|uniref:beta-glucosidase n=1 Tax=Dictyostelium purpureum TaxID=5786 RepID=F0ZN52_DICPU|nr:beta glucosidase [Dictyostelium purpureum]EGC34619.1 beta glucosidase [Dictyostelium purpureum]|eukprot:XP_003288844.1 beta glucosidase [Dictyostelium purpureum]